MGVARQLLLLQEVDLELQSNEQSLARATSQIGESAAVINTRQELEREEKRLEELRHQEQSAEWEIDDYTAKLAQIEEKLYSGRITNPKELANMQHEVDILKGQRGRVEDRALELMEQVSQGEARVAALDGELTGLEAEWRGEQEGLLADVERYKEIIADLKEKRQQALAGIAPSAVGIYDNIKRQKGWAVARVERGTCRSCGITLSTAQLQQARGEELLRCSNCGRILFLA